MKRYRVIIQFTGRQYITVDVPNGENVFEFADGSVDIDEVKEWDIQSLDYEEVDPHDF